MDLHTLSPAPGAVQKKKRVGRGSSSGRGTTAGRGSKGQLSRSGGGKGPGFEGGQTPLARRLPKLPGFRNPFKKVFALVNLDQLQSFAAGAEVGPAELLERGLIGKNLPIKVLGRGELDRALTVKAHAFSSSARAKIEAAGGKVEMLR
ncbi:MAG: 50S ribosomal protein L15 [Actinobacteria bacterium]|nr:50S ribosomal protein L15 [Actinomycetota bacterium]